MANRFAEIAFTAAVQAAQEARGSRTSYARMTEGDARNDRLGVILRVVRGQVDQPVGRGL